MRQAIEAMAKTRSLSLDAAVIRIGTTAGVVPDTLRERVMPARVDNGWGGSAAAGGCCVPPSPTMALDGPLT